MNVNSKIEKEFSAIILAAGKSERIGFPKLSLKFDDKSSFVEHIVREYLNFGCKEIVLVVNDAGLKCLNNNATQFPGHVKIAINDHPDWHRFYSLKIGAKLLSKFNPVIIHNVDNPFVSNDVLTTLLSYSEKADYVIPLFEEKGGHPILLSENIVRELNSIKENQLHLKEFLNQFSKMKVSVDDEKVLVNINTLEDYKIYFNL